MVDTITTQQVVIARSAEDKVVAGTCAQDVMSALAVYTVVAGAPQDNIVAVRANEDVVSGPPYQGGKSAESIHVLLLVHVVLGDIPRRAGIVIQPIACGGFIPGISLPRRRRCSGPGLVGVPHQEGGSDKKNGTDEQRHPNEVSRKTGGDFHFMQKACSDFEELSCLGISLTAWMVLYPHCK